MKKLIWLLVCISLIFSLSLTVSAESEGYEATIIIDDQADLLLPSQRSALGHKAVYADFPFTIVISTVDSIGFQSPKQFANERYDVICNSDHGILLLVAMESRDWYILTVGEVHQRISDSECQKIAKTFISDLSSGQYNRAFDTFLSELTEKLDSSYSVGVYLIPVAIGLIVGLITILIMRSAMNTAKPQRSATGYVKDGTFHLHKHYDFYLYSRVTKIPRPKSTSPGGGGSRGGSGGKF